MKITVTEDGKIIKEYLLDNGFSISQIRTLKKTENGITVNGEPSTVGRLLKNGDILELNTEDACPTPVEPADIPLDILYEDDDILCVNKPKGLATHPHGQHTKTLANAFVYKYPTLVFRPVSRLDANTSGIVLIAKNRYVSNLLASEISCGSIKKTYIAILDGIPPEKAGNDKRANCAQSGQYHKTRSFGKRQRSDNGLFRACHRRRARACRSAPANGQNAPTARPFFTYRLPDTRRRHLRRGRRRLQRTRPARPSTLVYPPENKRAHNRHRTPAAGVR